MVPREAEKDVLLRAFDKGSWENTTRDELLKGARLTEVFERYGVL